MLTSGQAGVWQVVSLPDVPLFSYISVLWGLSLLLWLSPTGRVTGSSSPLSRYPKRKSNHREFFQHPEGSRAFTLGSSLARFSTKIKASIIVTSSGVGRGV